MPAARYSRDLVGHGVGGQRDDRRARRGPSRPPRSRIARGGGRGRPSPASACPSGSGPSSPRPGLDRLARRWRPSPARRRPGRSRVFSTSWLTALSSAASTRSAACGSAARRRRGRARWRPAPRRRRAQRQVDGEGRALARARSRASIVAAHQLGQLAADRQAQARAAVAAGGRGVGLVELLEQAGRASPARCRCRCRRPADASTLAVAARRVTRDLAGLGELQGVGDQVVEDLAHAVGSPR